MRQGTGTRSSTKFDSIETPAQNTSKVRAVSRAANDEPGDLLTPEEEYLLRIFRRYRKETPSSPNPGDKIPSKASPSPTPEHGTRKGSPVPNSSPPSNDASGSSTLPKARDVSPTPTDTKTRLKMVLERKRKELAVSRIGAAASGAGVLKKAKINKGVGGTSSTSAKLDPVKYPSTGLLLLGEFRTFEEGEEDGERVCKPTEPLLRDLKNFGLADASGGNKQLNETLVMRLTVPPHSQSWGINISPAGHDNFSDVLFHFNPRRRFVAMNNRKDKIWGQQEKYMMQRWPELFNVSIVLAIQIDKVGFRVAIDGKYCATFAHRTPVPENGEQLDLQVMTADDYGTSLGLVVHEIWWGHKDKMPGLPEDRDRQGGGSRGLDSRRSGEADDSFTDLHIANLPPMPSPEEQEMMRKRLLDLFDPYGAIQVRVFHREKCYGFAKFRDHRGAMKALEELNGEAIQGRSIRLSRTTPR